jgi:peptidoglycan/xylan/chitin deacetylase (PgdA/CDA1 family)
VSHADFRYLSPAEAEADLLKSRSAIEQAIGVVPDAFAIPIGGSRNWTAGTTRIAREVGYALIYAQAEERRPAGTIARTFVTRYDGDRLFRAALGGAFDRWEEWV